MTPRYGIDTSILVRLLTGEPPDLFELCVESLRRLVTEEDGEILASNMVIGEAYLAVQHHYGVSKSAAREALGSVLKSGYVSPLGGAAVYEALATSGGAGLLDRLISLDHARDRLATLTLDERMAKLPDARLLRQPKPTDEPPVLESAAT